MARNYPQQQQIPVSMGPAGGSNTTRINQIAPTQGFSILSNPKPYTATFSEKLWKLLFFLHLLAVTILIGFLSIRGFLSHIRRFHPRHWYLPLLASASCSVLTAVAWLLFALYYPTKALKSSLWLSPLLTCAVGILLFDTGTGIGLAIALITIVSALFQSLYGCWTASRLNHANDILTASLTAVQAAFGVTKFVVIALVNVFLFSSLWILGVGGVNAHGSRFAALYIFLLLLSLAWTMQVVRNILHVAISRTAYMHFANGITGINASEAFRMARTSLLGSICFGSVVVPAIGVFRGIARSLTVVARGTDEFLFSCVSCYMGVANQLVATGSRWGFVHVGVYQKSFVAASRDVWEHFRRTEMEAVVDSDLTSSLCFLSGVAGGMLSALVGGVWTRVVDKSYTLAVTAYAFLIGYFMMRVAMVWPQACVSSYHVAYAENPQNPRFGSTLRNRIRHLQSP